MSEVERPYRVARTERTHIGRITVIKDTIVLNGREYPYTYVDYRDSVCVLPVFEGRVIAITQYRHTLNSWELELPCGGVEPKERPEEAARRELREETGYLCGKMFYMGKYYTNQGYSSAVCHVFFTHCTGCGSAEREETELICMSEIPLTEFDAMTKDGRFKLLIGIEAWNQAKFRGLI